MATALAEGRTPSPEAVANAGSNGSLAPPVATSLLVATVLGVVLVAFLASRATIGGLAHLRGPWDQPGSPRESLQPEPILFQYLYGGLFCLLLIGAIELARRNLSLGLGDTAGAWRLAIFLFVCHMISMALIADHVPSFGDEAVWLMKAVGFAGLWSSLCWLLYFALEPYVRRRWPWRMISWNRLLAGRFPDPMVGRDVLIGAALGIFLALMLQLAVILPPHFGRPAPLPLATWPSAFTHVPFHLLMELPLAIKDALQWFFLLFLLVMFVRYEWLASALVLSLILIYYLIQEPELHLFWAAVMAATNDRPPLFVSACKLGLMANTAGLFLSSGVLRSIWTCRFGMEGKV